MMKFHLQQSVRIMTEFDQLFHGIVTQINDILSPNKTVTLEDGTKVKVLDEDNCSYGANGEIGVELFSREGNRQIHKADTYIGRWNNCRILCLQ